MFRIGEKDGTSENPNDSAWNSTKRVVSFWMKGECASLNVQVSASTGAKYVQYLFGTGTNGALSGGNAKVYLGYAAPEDWVRFERNVEADFEAYAGGGATWTNTDGLYIHWPKSLLSYAFYVDDLRLSDSLTVEHNTLGPGVIGHILRHTTWDATTLARTDRWFHYDQVGSVLNESDANGDDVTRHEQDAFGNVMQGWSSGLWSGFQGSYYSTKRLEDSTTFYYVYERWLDPQRGLFVSSSPLSTLVESRFGAVANNPVEFIDYNGLALTRREKRLIENEDSLDTTLAISCALYSVTHYNVYRSAGMQDLHADAMKHCILSCCLAATLGSKKAKRWGDAHEYREDGKVTGSNRMDLRNNKIGRGLVKNRIVCRHNPAGCKEACENAIVRGALQVEEK